jgi:hypothetical protein
VTSNGQNVSPAARELVESLLLRWSNHKKDAAQIVMYRNDVAALIAECGLSRVQAAAEKARTHCNFLPEPAELRELLPSSNINARYHDQNCSACHGSGWKLIDVIDSGTGRAEKRAVRCACVPSAPRAPESERAPALDLGPLHAILQQGVEQSLLVKKILPAPDPNRRAVLKEQLARMQERRAKREPDPIPATLTAPTGGLASSCRRARARR